MKLDLLIKNGRVIDTGASIDKKMDLGVKNGRFADITQLDEPLEAERVLEAEGYSVPFLAMDKVLSKVEGIQRSESLLGHVHD